MTRTEIMANRILPQQAVDDIIRQYEMEHYPSYEELRDSDEEIDTASRTYISPEKVQRMPPEDVVDYLANVYKDYDTNTTDGIVKLLALATGRTEDAIRNAVFGTGEFDARKFYQPTEKQKEILRFVFKATVQLAKINVKWTDWQKWPKDLWREWTDLINTLPDEAVDENIQECKEYIQYYIDNGIPLWLY